MQLKDFLVWVLGGGGLAITAVIVRFLISRIPKLKEWDEEMRSLLSAGIASVIVIAAFVAAASAEYVPRPETTLAWIEQLFFYVSVVIGIPTLMSTFMKARLKLIQRQARSYGTSAALSKYENKLFGIRW